MDLVQERVVELGACKAVRDTGRPIEKKSRGCTLSPRCPTGGMDIPAVYDASITVWYSLCVTVHMTLHLTFRLFNTRPAPEEQAQRVMSCVRVFIESDPFFVDSS